eukprot:3941026-Rhodomonas_salina.1
MSLESTADNKLTGEPNCLEEQHALCQYRTEEPHTLDQYRTVEPHTLDQYRTVEPHTLDQYRTVGSAKEKDAVWMHT